MVTVTTQPCPETKYNIKCPYVRTPLFVVVHNTGNDAPAKNEAAYMQRNDKEVSFHVAVDDKEALECLPFGRNGWASDDGTGDGNMYGIHIEICYSLSGGERFTKAERNAAEYIAGLLKRYGWGLAQVRKHQDFDGKYCPHRTLDLGWQRFLNMIKSELDKLNKKEEPELTEAQVREMAKKEAAAEYARQNPVYNTIDEVPDYWREDVRWIMNRGILRGNANGKLGLSRSECKAAVLVKRGLEKAGVA